MKNLIAVLLLFVGWSSDVVACSCDTFSRHLSATFLQEAGYRSWNRQEFKPTVLRVSIKEHVEHGADLKVEEVLAGSESNSEVRVWGTPQLGGGMCRDSLKRYEVGTQWIFYLLKIDLPRLQGEKIGDYELQGMCGVYALKVEGEGEQAEVVGSVEKREAQRVPLSEFKPWLAKTLSSIKRDFQTVAAAKMNCKFVTQLQHRFRVYPFEKEVTHEIALDKYDLTLKGERAEPQEGSPTSIVEIFENERLRTLLVFRNSPDPLGGNLLRRKIGFGIRVYDKEIGTRAYASSGEVRFNLGQAKEGDVLAKASHYVPIKQSGEEVSVGARLECSLK